VTPHLQDVYAGGWVLGKIAKWGQDDDRRRSYEAGFNHHMIQVVDPQALMKILAGLQTAKKTDGA